MQNQLPDCDANGSPKPKRPSKPQINCNNRLGDALLLTHKPDEIGNRSFHFDRPPSPENINQSLASFYLYIIPICSVISEVLDERFDPSQRST